MRISLNWLNDYVYLKDQSPEALANLLTDLGLEVEGIERRAPIASGVVVGRIVSAVAHPNADSLRACKVDIGKGEPLPIVCGAPNAREGLTVAVATVGTELPGNFKIKASKIRGETSEGMLCSEKELGLSSADAGIVELENQLPLGQPLVEALRLADVVLTLNVTPNRPDCLGYLGVAREVAGKLGRELKIPVPHSGDEGLSTKTHVRTKVESQEGCQRYDALYIQGVSTAASPLWLRQRLEASGMRPINLVVDATNYVMLEFGQPIHPYDERDVTGRLLSVREARAGESLTTLDGRTLALVAGDLLICDEAKPVGLAGIMGGANSEVKPDTRNVIMEVAAFNPALVRKTAKRLDLHTEASHRFERGVDIGAVATVARRVGDLLAQVTVEVGEPRPKVAYDLVEEFPEPPRPARIALRLPRARQMLAMPRLSQEDVVEHLVPIGFTLLDRTDERMLFEVPTWRHDIEREVDLIEELARTVGYDKIPYAMPVMDIRPTPENPLVTFFEDARVLLAQTGFSEIISFPFISAADLAAFNLTGQEAHPLACVVRIANPLAEEHAFMQPVLSINLVKAVAANRRRGERGARLFESGRGYLDLRQEAGSGFDRESFSLWADLGTPPALLTARAAAERRAHERDLIAGIIDFPVREKGWNASEEAPTFFHGKEALLSWFKGLGVMGARFEPINARQLPFLNPRAAATVFLGERFAGFVGELHPKTALAYDFSLTEVPIIFEIASEALYAARAGARGFDTTIHRFPPSTRDLALLVNDDLTHAKTLDALERFPKRRYLKSYRLFDVYTGERLPSGKKSVAYAFSFQSPEKTLTDKEVESELAALVAWLKESLGAEQRS